MTIEEAIEKAIGALANINETYPTMAAKLRAKSDGEILQDMPDMLKNVGTVSGQSFPEPLGSILRDMLQQAYAQGIAQGLAMGDRSHLGLMILTAQRDALVADLRAKFPTKEKK